MPCDKRGKGSRTRHAEIIVPEPPPHWIVGHRAIHGEHAERAQPSVTSWALGFIRPLPCLGADGIRAGCVCLPRRLQNDNDVPSGRTHRLRGAGAGDGVKAGKSFAMVGDGLGREIGGGTRFKIEVPEAIAATHQHRGVPHRRELAQVGRDVPCGESDAPVRTAVWGRAVHDQHVMERHLAGGQHDVDRILLVDVSRDLLTARQQIVPVGGVAMGELARLAARHDAHAAGLRRTWAERNPRGHHIVRGEAQ